MLSNILQVKRAFGIFDCETRRLIGSVEANLAFFPEPGRANMSYSVFPAWRGRSLALRSLDLMHLYLKKCTQTHETVLRIVLENARSLRVAEKSGFRFCGAFYEQKGHMALFTRQLP